MRIRFAAPIAALALAACAACAACSSGTTLEPGDGGAAAPLDLRFRGVGGALISLGGEIVGAGAGAGQPGGIRVFEGASFGVAGLGAQGFLLKMLAAPGLARHSTTMVIEGVACPERLEDAVASNSLVLGLGGNPLERGAPCTILTVRRLAGGPRYQYLHGGTRPAAGIVARLQSDETTRSMVVTAISEVGSLYTFVATGLAAAEGSPAEQFETRVETPALTEVGERAEALSSDGFVITASTWTGGPYALVGTRPVGSTARYTATVLDAGPAGEGIARLVHDGYAPVSITSGLLPDGKYTVKVVGQKPR